MLDTTREGGSNEPQFEEVDGQAEGIEDADVDQEKFNNTTIIQTDWTVSTIIDQVRRGIIDVNPDFQRRDAWDRNRKTNYIESLILGIPVPPIVLAELPGKKGRFVVIDGKQRLLSMMQFFAGKNDPSGFKPFKLREPPIIKSIKGMGCDALSSTPYMVALENQSVRTNVIRGVKDEDVLYQIFLRLNTGSVKLAAQELRQALHPGDFLKYIDDYCAKSDALSFIFSGRVPDFRMRDAELLLRYLAFRTRLSDYQGNLKQFLDETVKYWTSRWDDNGQNAVVEESVKFEQAVAAVRTIFGDRGAFRFWLGDEYETRFNRALFDVMLFYLADLPTRERALANPKAVEDKFKELCVSDNLFGEHVRLTTKSLDATRYRMNTWRTGLLQAIGGETVASPLG